MATIMKKVILLFTILLVTTSLLISSVILRMKRRERSCNKEYNKFDSSFFVETGIKVKRLGYFEDLNRLKTDIPWEMLKEKILFQQSQVHNFCQKEKRNKDLITRQILIDDEAKTLLCYVPKAGCSTLKVIFFYMQGAIPRDIFKSKGHPDEEWLELAINKRSLMAKSEQERDHILNTYFKFIMYRNPAERLISAYRSKIEAYPLYGLDESVPERNWLRRIIYKFINPKGYTQWLIAGGKIAINISFPEFINFWLHDNGTRYDEHFQTIYELCQPCKVNYSYYGNFNTFRKDAAILLEKIGGNLSHLPGPNKWPERTTADVASKYYSLIPDFKKKQIIDLLAKDLSFYYTIFPSEKNRHKAIMGIDYDIPRPL